MLKEGFVVSLLSPPTWPQTERAFQKQRGVFLNAKAGLTGKKKKKEQRFVRNVGLGFKTPREVWTLVCVVWCVHVSVCGV